jgi:hypothetical protein
MSSLTYELSSGFQPRVLAVTPTVCTTNASGLQFTNLPWSICYLTIFVQLHTVYMPYSLHRQSIRLRMRACGVQMD